MPIATATTTTSLTWRRARASASSGQCVELALASDALLVRDSKHPAGPRLTLDASARGALLALATGR